MIIDHSVYPDLEEPPEDLPTPEDKADYVHRICASFDFGVPPEEATIRLLSGWKDVFDKFPVASSPAYHAFRMAYGWEEVPRRECFNIAYWERCDAREGREDPCLHMV